VEELYWLGNFYWNHNSLLFKTVLPSCAQTLKKLTLEWHYLPTRLLSFDPTTCATDETHFFPQLTHLKIGIKIQVNNNNNNAFEI
jgi:hypothetical protein